MLYFIVNQTAKSGKSADIWIKTKQCLKDSVIEYKAYETKYKGHATKIASRLCSLPDEKVSVVVVGGDGTVNEVLNGITDFQKIMLGVIPAGSGNDFAKGLHIKKDVTANITQIAIHEKTGNVRDVDLGMVYYDGLERPKVFGISSGVGLDAIVCKKAQHSALKKFLNIFHLGKLVYLLTTVSTLFSMDTSNVLMELQKKVKDEERYFRMERRMKNAIFVASMNLRAEGGGVPMAPLLTGTDGFLAFSSASGIPKWKTFFCLPILVLGKQDKINGFDIQYAQKCTMKLSKPMTLHADGEYCGEVKEVVYECLPGLLQILN